MPNKTNHPGPSVTPGRNVYRGVRDPIVLDAGASTLSPSPLGAGTEIGNSYPLCPLGSTSVSIGTGGTPQVVQVSKPVLPFLYRTALNFQQYRVTRATLVFVGSQGSTATGRITLSGSTDWLDVGAAVQQFGLVNAKQFDLAAMANKEARFPLAVDSTWKRVSVGMIIPGPNNTLVPVATINDLSFTTAQFYATGTSGTGNIGALYVEYDVEFKWPISQVVNV